MTRTALLFTFLSIALISAAQEKLQYTVQFERDSYSLSQDQKEKLLAWLREVPDTVSKVEAVGHADFLANDSYNLNLSERRANAVMAVIETAKLFHYNLSLTSAQGEEGSTPNGSEDGNPSDRKVEITIYLDPKPEAASSGVDRLMKVEAGQTVVLKDLNFYGGQHYLLPEAYPELKRLISIMEENPTLEIEIQGHICCKLDSIDGYDQISRTHELSHNRAKYIYDRLVWEGIDSTRMAYRGFAGTRPLVKPEKTAEDRTRNRRVEIKVLKK